MRCRFRLVGWIWLFMGGFVEEILLVVNMLWIMCFGKMLLVLRRVFLVKVGFVGVFINFFCSCCF